VIDVIIFNSDDTLVLLLHYSLIVINVVIVICFQCFDAVGFVWQEGHPAHKNMGNGGGGHWLVRMEWQPAGWSVCLSLLISPCTIKSRSSLLAPAHPGEPRKSAVKRLWCGVVHINYGRPM